jgi:single-strand DNA-binding protein
MNVVILMGRLTRDPDTRINGDSTVTRFTIAVDRRFRRPGDEEGQSADFPSCTAFGKTAEFISKYFRQGTKIAVIGRLQTGSYTNKDGVKVYTTEVIVNEVHFAERKGIQESGQAETAPANNGEWLNVPDDIINDLPFK